MNQIVLQYVEADESLQQQIASQWGEIAARHLHFVDGFSAVAVHQGEPIGLISIYWRKLPPPFANLCEGYIDIIEVVEPFRRKGIARKLISLSIERARKKGVYQLHAWSSEDKTEAILMWQSLGFGLCPATISPNAQEIEGFFVTKVL